MPGSSSMVLCVCANVHHHMELGEFSEPLVLGRDVHCEFDYWPLAVSMPPTKVCPQCKTAVPVRRKICERCDHVENRANFA